MFNRILRNSLLFTAGLTALLIGSLPSCTKDKPIAIPSVPYHDTLAMLTNKRWSLNQIWQDMNNNQRIDNGEVISGLGFPTFYRFYTNGTVTDSTEKYLSRTGSWNFVNYHTTFSIKWTSIAIDQHQILYLDDSLLTTKRLGTNETWYMKTL